MSRSLGQSPTLIGVGDAFGTRVLTLTSPTTAISIPDGSTATVALVQDITGGRTVTWPAGVRWASGTPTLNVSAGSVDVFTFIKNGTGSWLGFATASFRNTYRQIATRSGVSTYQQATSGGFSQKTERFRVVVTTTGTDPTVSFSNLDTTGIGVNPITFGASIEIGGTIYPFKFGGNTKVTLQPGDHITSDALIGVTVPTGYVYIRTYQGLADSTKQFSRSNGIYLFSGNGEGTSRQVGTDLTAAGSAAVPAGSDYGTPPLALAAKIASGVTTPAFAISGDSITETQQDDNQADPTHSGYAVRGLVAANLPYINYARGGDKVGLMTAARRLYWFEGLGVCTHAITAYAINDIAGNATLATLQANSIDFWNYLAGKKLVVRQTTCTPYQNSTDAFATETSQTSQMTAGNETTRVNWNAWLRDGAPILNGTAVATGSSAVGTIRAGAAGHPLNGILDTAAIVESTANPGKWIAADRTVTDGAITSGTKALTSASASFTSADVTKTIVLTGAGASGANLVTTITAVNSATSATVAANAGTTVSAASLAIGTHTLDGLHPSPLGHSKMASVVQNWASSVTATAA